MAETQTAKADSAKHATPRALVLCLDGTGNKFRGDEGDTNIVKIYEMLRKQHSRQYVYYQRTYVRNRQGTRSGSPISKLRRRLYTMVDQAVGYTFVDHVLGGYDFIMRYYQKHDEIYIFGFSRGAYTARFLAEMIHSVGLLTRGNEEMVQFAWETFSKFQTVRGTLLESQNCEESQAYMHKFRDTFSRPDVSVHFLGLFDCVNSVGQFEIPFFRSSYRYIATPAAKHIRHAVSLHERRLKFRPALFFFDNATVVDCKEVWFAGNHGDVGGGWKLVAGQTELLSDIPLTWMIQEVMHLPDSQTDLAFDLAESDRKRTFSTTSLDNTSGTALLEHGKSDRKAVLHDMLRPGGGAHPLARSAWWAIEFLPIFRRLELKKGKWVPRYLPPGLRAARDIPQDAVIHESVEQMIKAGFLTAEPRKGGHE